MKRTLFSIILMLLAIPSFSQGMYGASFGLGMGTAYKSKLTPRLEGYLMAQVSERMFLGGSLGIERYSFTYASGLDMATGNAGDILTIKQKSSYIYFAPRADYGFGYRKYVRAHASVGLGISMGGMQETVTTQTFPGAPTGPLNYASDKNTTYNIPALMMRYGIGLSERIPTHGFFNIIISQDFGYLSKSFHKGAAPDLRTSYIAVSVGFMHNYNQVLVEY